MNNIDEYLRRNLLHASSVGVRANIEAAIKRLASQKRTPKWLMQLLKQTCAQAERVRQEMADHRNEVRPPNAKG